VVELLNKAGSDARAPGPGPPSRLRRLPLLVTLVAGVAFVVGTIGPPLIGRGVFLATDVLTSAYPWRAVSDPAAENIGVHGPVGDTIDAGYPFRSTFADALRDGDFLGWNPYPVGGTVQGADGSGGTLSLFELLYVVFPTWFAPAAIKLVQLLAAIGFTFLFCRRLGAGQVASLVGGLAFAGSGFMVMWTNWPQPEVAALIPAAFWATERFLATPTVRSACPIALAMAAMLLGNFPAVVFHTLYVLVPYVIVRVALMHRQTLRRALALIGGAGAAVVTGALVVAAVLIPFALRLQFLGTESRSQNPQLRLGLDTLLTTVAPKALGLSTEGPNALYFGAYNQVETISFVGATVAVLAVAGVALPRLRATPRGVREVLMVATLVIGWAAYVGGDVLAQLQRLPGFEESFVGRTRAILGFMVAVLAALGLQALVERRWPAGRRQWAWAGAAIGAAGLTAAYAGNRALWRGRGVGQVDVLREQLVLPAVVGIGALVALALVRWGGRRAALAAMAAVPVLLVIESLALSLPLLPNEDRSTVYPTTAGIDFLAERAGDERIAFQDLTLYGSATAIYGLRSVTGHAFNSPTWKEAVTTIDPDAFSRSGTFAFMSGTSDVMTSPLLDRLGARWFASTPETVPPGERRTTAAADASCETTTDFRDEVTLSVPADDGIRGVILRVCESVQLPVDATIEVQASGATLPARVPLTEAVDPGELPITVPSEDPAPEGTVDVRLSLAGAEGQALRLAARPDGGIVADAVHVPDDGLRLAYVDDLVVFHRSRGLPRFRWAGRATTVTDDGTRLRRLATGTVADGTVLLSEDGPAGSGDTGDVTMTRDTPTSLAATVRADGDGYLVVADALQQGWVAEVDGEGADLVDADHAGVAVYVPGGRHEVTLRYAPPGQRAGLAVSAVSAAGLAAAWIWGDRLASRVRRRRRPQVGQPSAPTDQRPSSEVRPP
jgi:Bacterial membrane protein YfhO